MLKKTQNRRGLLWLKKQGLQRRGRAAVKSRDVFFPNRHQYRIYCNFLLSSKKGCWKSIFIFHLWILDVINCVWLCEFLGQRPHINSLYWLFCITTKSRKLPGWCWSVPLPLSFLPPFCLSVCLFFPFCLSASFFLRLSVAGLISRALGQRALTGRWKGPN